MKVSELIAALQALAAEVGDVEVLATEGECHGCPNVPVDSVLAMPGKSGQIEIYID